MSISRRQFLKLTAASGAGLAVPWSVRLGGSASVGALGAFAASPLSDPAAQPKFVNYAPNALDPGFKYTPSGGPYTVGVGPTTQWTGLVTPAGKPLNTPLFGYGQNGVYTWPGKTFEIQSGGTTTVKWENNLARGRQAQPHLLPVDTSLHWAYSLHDYENYSINKDGIPIVVHLHGGHTDYEFDGNPEFFYNPTESIRGPQWAAAGYNSIPDFVYDNDVPAGNLWYHDHALGITRLNVYAGMAGFYFVRDDEDTGQPDNPLELPAWPYELAYAIQDRMFQKSGRLFYPAFPSDPYWDDFIRNEGLNTGLVPKPSALAEFFGDHMVVNGLIWPKVDVEPRQYRMRLLNGTDSRFMAIRFALVGDASDEPTTIPGGATRLPFWVIGSDQGLASSATQTDMLLSEPGSRYDIVFDFSVTEPDLAGKRIIMENIGGDEPFGGDIPGTFLFGETNRIMAFDVVKDLYEDDPQRDHPVNPFNSGSFGVYVPDTSTADRLRKVALFEGKDEYGRLQPLLGTAEPATDYRGLGYPIDWPNEQPYIDAGLSGQMEGSIPWHAPTTENPKEGDIEDWDIFNVTGDAHPVHLHLVHFDIVGRWEINWDSAADDDGFIPDGTTPADDGIYLVSQPVVQHNGTTGNGFKIVHPSDPLHAYGSSVGPLEGYVENAPKDMVTALPSQITRIKATFDKPGRYVWHCHILSHEDHEMMRVLHVGGGA
jgi:spore coat protein A